MSFTGKSQEYLDTEVANLGFFPVLNVGDFQRIYKVPAELTTESVVHQLKLARNRVNEQLNLAVLDWVIDGFVTLSDVDDANDTDMTTEYFEAVFCKAKAALINDFETFSRRDIAQNIAREGEDTFQSLEARSDRAVRIIMGKTPNIDAELI